MYHCVGVELRWTRPNLKFTLRARTVKFHHFCLKWARSPLLLLPKYFSSVNGEIGVTVGEILTVAVVDIAIVEVLLQ